jgi:hypothetical protein
MDQRGELLKQLKNPGEGLFMIISLYKMHIAFGNVRIDSFCTKTIMWPLV